MRHGALVTKELAILERPVQRVSEAGGLLGLRPDRARAWLDGYERFGVRYPPVIREVPTGDDLVTWGEFVELDLPTQIAIVVRSGQQVLLADAAKQFFKKAEFDPSSSGAIQRIRPAGPASPVVIDPLVRFGRPAVSGVSTDRLWELSDAGESIEEIAAGSDLPEDEVRAAVAYEEQFRSLAA